MAGMLQRLLTLGVLLLLTGLTSALKGPPELSAFLGWPLSLGCQYEEGFRTHKKYWCKGPSQSSCTTVVETDGTEAEAKAGRTSIQDNHSRLEFTVRLEDVSQEDAGIYWCGIKQVGYDPGFQIQITALPAPTPAITTAVITTNVPTVTDFPTTATPSHDFLYMILLPIVFLVLVVILIGAVLLMCRLKKQKAAKACKDVPWSSAPSASVQPTDGHRREEAPLPLNPIPGNTTETEYASVRMAPTSVDSLPQAFTNTENISYATLKFSTLEEEPTYANVE
uniref:CMRF35-like molecule 1 isoform X1 n=1 Tax=Pogona vitticeps TaxID=103695 RepID=A0ABM5FMR0_9SAUR